MPADTNVLEFKMGTSDNAEDKYAPIMSSYNLLSKRLEFEMSFTWRYGPPLSASETKGCRALVVNAFYYV